MRAQFPKFTRPDRGLVVDFVFRAWPGWFALLTAIAWWWFTGGSKTEVWCAATPMFEQIWNTIALLMVATGLYDLWALQRAQGTPDYADKRPWAFIALAVLLSLWTIVMCNRPG